MQQNRFVLSVRFALGVVLSIASISKAVIVDGVGGAGLNNTTPSSYPVAALDNVGIFNGGSATYVGNNWILTTAHDVPSVSDYGNAGSYTLILPDGTTASNDGLYHQLTTPGNGGADLVMVHLMSATVGSLSSYPTLSLATTSPGIRTSIYDIGNGLTRGTTTSYESHAGYNEIAPNIIRWGSNSTVDTSVISAGGATTTVDEGYGSTTIFTSEFGSSTTQLSSGDSGGGVFSTAGLLEGINLYSFTFDGQPDNTAVSGNVSGFADVATYEGQIAEYLPTPEPGSLGLIFFGISAGLIRRRVQRIQV